MKQDKPKAKRTDLVANRLREAAERKGVLFKPGDKRRNRRIVAMMGGEYEMEE